MWLCFFCGKSVVDIYCERVRVPCLLLGQAHQMWLLQNCSSSQCHCFGLGFGQEYEQVRNMSGGHLSKAKCCCVLEVFTFFVSLPILWHLCLHDGATWLEEFFELVKSIGESRSKQEEDKIIVGEIAILKQHLSAPNISAKKMKEGWKQAENQMFFFLGKLNLPFWDQMGFVAISACLLNYCVNRVSRKVQQLYGVSVWEFGI